MKLSKKLLGITGVGLLALTLGGCGSHHATQHSGSTSTKSEDVISHKSHSKKPTKKNTSHKSDKQDQDKKDNSASDSASHSSSSSESATPSHDNSNSASDNTSSNAGMSKDGLPLVNLGHGIEGEEDRGAGQEYISFSVNGTPVIIHGNDVEPGESALSKAREVANYGQTHHLGSSTIHMNSTDSLSSLK